MITSRSNELIKHIKSLSQKKERDINNEYVVEGIKMIKEAIDMKIRIQHLIVCGEILEEKQRGLMKENFKGEVVEVSKNVFEYISDTKTPQGILAVIKRENSKKEYSNTIFALDDVQDPGNVGTIIRTLDCTGIKSVILSEKCADVYNSKVIRSTMGAIYRINIFNVKNLYEELEKLKENGYEILVSTLEESQDLFEYKYKEKTVVVIGNESNGVNPKIQDIANSKIKIPMVGKTESLNAGVAASIIAYDIFRKSGRIY